jgi:hypothetical protein
MKISAQEKATNWAENYLIEGARKAPRSFCIWAPLWHKTLALPAIQRIQLIGGGVTPSTGHLATRSAQFMPKWGADLVGNTGRCVSNCQPLIVHPISTRTPTPLFLTLDKCSGSHLRVYFQLQEKNRENWCKMRYWNALQMIDNCIITPDSTFNCEYCSVAVETVAIATDVKGGDHQTLGLLIGDNFSLESTDSHLDVGGQTLGSLSNHPSCLPPRPR